MLGAAIAAGASLISGLFGRSSAKKQAKKEEEAIRRANDQATALAQQMNKEVRARADAAALVPVQTSKEHAEGGVSSTRGGVDMAAFMAAAEDYGFNPLTFLRSGALSLFATSETEDVRWSDDFICTTGESAMEAALSGQHMPSLQPVIASTRVPGVGEVLGNALQAGTNQYLSDMSQDQQNAFQMDLLNRQLAGSARPGSYSGPRSAYVPTASLNGSVTKTNEIPELWITVRDNNPNSPTFGQTFLVPNPDMPDAEAWLVPPLVSGKTDKPIGVNIRPGSIADKVIDTTKKTYNTPGNLLSPLGSLPPPYIIYDKTRSFGGQR